MCKFTETCSIEKLVKITLVENFLAGFSPFGSTVGVVWVRSSPSQVDGLMKYVAVVVVPGGGGGVGAVRCARRPLFGGAIAF